MKYPGNLVGPRIEDGDLVSFTFDGAELTLRLPIIQLNRDSKDVISRKRDFRGINTTEWDVDNQDRPIFQLTEQCWKFSDATGSLDNIAICRLTTGIGEVSRSEQDTNMILDATKFPQAMLDSMKFTFEEDDEDHKDDPTWPTTAKNYHMKTVERKHLDWVSFEVSLCHGERPSPWTLIPINNRFVMVAYISLGSLHYSDGRRNPYSDELLKKFEFEFFDEFLAHIDLRYSPETIALIDSLKSSS